MKLHENAPAADALVHLAWAAQEHLSHRAPGIHVADITGCSRKAWYKRFHQPVYNTDDMILFLIGTGHHTMIQNIAKLPGSTVETEVELRYVQPGVTIHGTCDLIIHEDDGDPCVEPDELPCEIKTTRSSSAKPIESSSHYIEQDATYAMILGVLRARLYVLHMMGNYRDIRTPVMNCWELTFRPDELARWAEEVERRYRLIMQDTPPDPYEAYSWECQYCPYFTNRGGPCPGGGLRVPFFNQDRPTMAISLEDGSVIRSAT